MKINSILFLFICLISACKTKTEISGDVFAVTDDSGNYKFGAVSVSAFPIDDSAKKSLETNQTALSSALKEAEEYDKSCWKLSQDARINCLRDAGDMSRDAKSAYFAKLPNPSATAKTDADGKFTLNIKGAGDYAVFAQAERMASGEKREVYFWIAKIKSDGKPQKLSLSNSNILGSSSAKSLTK